MTATTERFLSHVVKGPAAGDCWLWVGAIADDGYGRFWLDGRTLRPHRYVVDLVTPGVLTAESVVEHLCDNPICVRYAGDPSSDHLAVSTQAANLARMAALGRGGGSSAMRRFRGLDRRAQAERSRRLRDAAREGWNREAINAALAGDQPGLFDPP